MDMITSCMQEWSMDYTCEYGSDRAGWLQMLRNEAFDTTARKAILRKESQRNEASVDELQPGALVLYWLHPTDANRVLKKTIGGAKMKPLWSPLYRVIRKITTRENTYLIRSLWHIRKPKAVPREELLEIKGTWSYQEAQEALKELMADLQQVRGQQEVGADQDLGEIFKPLERPRGILPPDRFLQQLMEEASVTSVHPEGEISNLEEDLILDSLQPTSKSKRPRTMACITWEEFDTLLPSPSVGPQDCVEGVRG